MAILRLPATLPGTLDLADINARLRTNAIQLDWSGVVAVTASLTPLFSDIALDRGAEALGIASIPPGLAEVITACIDAPEADWAWRADGAVQEAPAAQLRRASPVELRDRLQAMVLADLLGPVGGPEERIIDEQVRDRYLIGMLAPRRQPIAMDQQDELAVAGMDNEEEGTLEISASPAPGFIPSSFGFSCSIDGSATAVTLTGTWGRYERVTDEQRLDPKTQKPLRFWQRSPMGGSKTFPLRVGRFNPFAPDPSQPEVFIGGIIRRRADLWICTFFLVNDQPERKRNRDAAWLFQPELSVKDPDGRPIFCGNPNNSASTIADLPADEEAVLRLRFRHAVEFAAGHGVSVQTDTLPGTDRATRISTCVAPVYEIGQTIAPPLDEFPGLVLDMRALAELDGPALIAALTPLTDTYARWLEQQAARLERADPDLMDHLPASRAAIAEGRTALTRIQAGIDCLAHDTLAGRAFRFMNGAMWQQRVRTLYAEAIRHAQGQAVELESIDRPVNRTWRPFQIAFILLNLPALTDPSHPDRSIDPDAVADLLWFPTGGGKTEAYLGLTAYTLAMRRLQTPRGGRESQEGVAVLMRYTLRLLTLQQFQRAAALICACEILRRDDPATWGTTPFRLGLWVGMHTTPNWTEDSQEALRTEHGDWYRPRASGTPAQLTFCPWCGAHIESSRHIKVQSYKQGAGRTLIYCGDRLGNCPFSERQSPGEGIPALVVDEEIYRRLPSLVIATVDKFAQLPWKGAVGMLFGQVDGWCPRHGFQGPGMPPEMRCGAHQRRGDLAATQIAPHSRLRPPDLIIQDELHLISGPLGTLVGLYETVVDRLATWNLDGQLVRPKVIASTATVRRAADQVRALFSREVRVFPPQGLDEADSFFARRLPPTAESPGRRYLGICAPGRRMKQTLIRVYVAFLAAAQTLYEREGYGTDMDPWMTLTGYFNAVRDLAGMKRLVDDDVRTRLQRVEEHGLARRDTPKVEELTSRRSSSDIPRILDLLEQGFDPARAKRRRSEPKDENAPGYVRPVDVLLATNMIAVGVDVKRLGLMVVAGQPKATAEYIQATSRVGRSHPGLVCTVYHWARPRDLSHYEHFAQYHATFYQHIEALSVTPFAPRALDRGLGALLVSLVRQLEPVLAGNEGAGAVAGHLAAMDEHIAAIVERASRVTRDTTTIDLVRRELAERRNLWLTEARRSHRLLGYEDRRDSATVGLLHHPLPYSWDPFTCLNSLREVEAEVHLILDDEGMDRDADRRWEPIPISEGGAV